MANYACFQMYRFEACLRGEAIYSDFWLNRRVLGGYNEKI